MNSISVSTDERFDRRHMHDPTLWLDRFASRVVAAPDHVAIDAPIGSLTYRELDAVSGRVATHLLGSGLRRGAVVATRFERTDPRAWTWMVGILKAGGCVYAIDPTVKTDVVTRRLRDIGDALAVVVTSNAPLRVLLGEAGFETWDPAAPPAPRLARTDPVTIQPEDAALLLQSSGTTGHPKIIRIPHRNLCDVVQTAEDRMASTGRFVQLQLGRCTFDAYAYEWLTAFGNGGTLALASNECLLDANLFADRILEAGVTNMVITPSHLGALWPALTQERRAAMMAQLKCVMVGGESCPPDLLAELAVLSKGLLFNGYGPCECTIMVSLSLIDRDGRRSPLDLGDVTHGVAIRVGVETGNGLELREPLEHGLEGPLWADNGTRNVYSSDELNRARYAEFLDEGMGEVRTWFNTGDRVRVEVVNGVASVIFIGRGDRQVKVAGQLVVTDHIQAELAPIARRIVPDGVEVPRIQVIAEPTAVAGTATLLGLITAADHDEAVRRVEALVRTAHVEMESFRVPVRWAWTTECPVKLNGKVDLDEFRARARPVRRGWSAESGEEITPELAEVMARVAEWVEVAPHPDMPLDELESLVLLGLHARIDEHWGRVPTIIELRTLTLRGLSTWLASGVAHGRASLCLLLREGERGAPPLFLCPPGDGSPQVYAPLVGLLEGDNAVYGFRCPGTELDEPLVRYAVEEYAEMWLAELEARCPDGPVHLGGFCLGGTVAWEMAHRLRSAGRSVETLLMLDAPDPGQTLPRMDPVALYSGLFDVMFECTIPPDELEAMGTCVDEWVDALVAHAASQGRVPKGLGLARIVRLCDMEELTSRSVPDYVPPRLDMEIHFVRAAHSEKMQWHAHPETWARLAAGMTVVQSDAPHLDMMRGAHVRSVAKVANELLTRVPVDCST